MSWTGRPNVLSAATHPEDQLEAKLLLDTLYSKLLYAPSCFTEHTLSRGPDDRTGKNLPFSRDMAAWRLRLDHPEDPPNLRRALPGSKRRFQT